MTETLVFVYGSLLTDLHNNHILGDSILLEKEDYISGFNMLDLGSFPALVLNDSNQTKIKGEVYKVTKSILKSLDWLEGYPSFYNRMEVNTEKGHSAFVYFIETNLNDKYFEPKEVNSGDWKEYYNNKPRIF